MSTAIVVASIAAGPHASKPAPRVNGHFRTDAEAMQIASAEAHCARLGAKAAQIAAQIHLRRWHRACSYPGQTRTGVVKEEPGMQKLGMSIFAAAMMFAVACDDGAVDKGGQAIRCQNICRAIAECTGADDDSTRDCRQECVDESTNDNFEEQAEECNECVDRDDSCTENAVNCATECAGVVALSAT